MLNVTCPEGTKKYKVKRGDTLSKIARDFNVPTALIITLNPTINPYMLYVGQEICVPRESVPECRNGFFYTVKRGDDFYKIAQQHGLTVIELKAANPFVDPFTLYIGQKICIPRRTTRCPVGSKEYEIKRGDTFYKIATNFNISYNSFMNVNPGININNLKADQKICIPPSIPSKVCPRGTNSYIIKPGENLTKVAEKFTVSAQDLLRVNPELTPSEFVAGRLICIPKATNV